MEFFSCIKFQSDAAWQERILITTMVDLRTHYNTYAINQNSTSKATTTVSTHYNYFCVQGVTILFWKTFLNFNLISLRQTVVWNTRFFPNLKTEKDEFLN